MKTSFRHAAATLALIVAVISPAAAQQKNYPQPIVAEKAYKWGYAFNRDKKQMVIDYIYDEAYEFVPETGQAIVKQGDKWGVIDPGGTWILDPVYEDIHLNPDYWNYTAKKNGKYGILDLKGDTVIGFEFDSIGPSSEGWYEGERDGNWVYISPTGRYTTSYSEYQKMLQEK